MRNKRMGEKITYVADLAPQLRTYLTIEGEEKKRKIQFHDKQLALDSEADAAVIAELDRLIETRPQFSQTIRKLDIAAAEAIALAHKAKMLKENAGQTGPATSQHDLARAAKMEEEKQRYLSQGISDEEASQLVHDVMSEQTIAVEKIENPVIQDVPKIDVEEGATDVADEEAKNLFAKLGGK